MSHTSEQLREEWKAIRPLLGNFVCHVDSTLRSIEDRERFDSEIEERIKETYQQGYDARDHEEEEKRETIQLGDEVIAEGDAKYIVTRIDDGVGGPCYSGIGLDGKTYCYFASDGVVKTGSRYKLFVSQEGIKWTK